MKYQKAEISSLMETPYLPWIHETHRVCSLQELFQQLWMILQYFSINELSDFFFRYPSSLKFKLQLGYWLSRRFSLNFCQALEIGISQSLTPCRKTATLGFHPIRIEKKHTKALTSWWTVCTVPLQQKADPSVQKPTFFLASEELRDQHLETFEKGVLVSSCACCSSISWPSHSSPTLSTPSVR